MGVPVLVVIGAILMILGGTFWLVVKVSQKYYAELYQSCTSTATGVVEKVVGARNFRNMGNGHTFFPVYKYTVDGEEYRCQGNKGAHKEDKVSREDVTIYYDPNKPGVSYTDRATNDKIFLNFKVGGTALLVLGALLIILELAGVF